MENYASTSSENGGLNINPVLNQEWESLAAALPPVKPELLGAKRSNSQRDNQSNYPMFDQAQAFSSVIITMAAQAETIKKMTDQHSVFDETIVHLRSMIGKAGADLGKTKDDLAKKTSDFDSEVVNHSATKLALDGEKESHAVTIAKLSKETENHKDTKNNLATAERDIAHLNTLLAALKKKKGLALRIWDVIKNPD